MSLKESFVFAVLAGGLIAAIAGFAFVSRGEPLGWIGVGLAAPMLFLAQRSMRLGSVTPTKPGAAEVEGGAAGD